MIGFIDYCARKSEPSSVGCWSFAAAGERTSPEEEEKREPAEKTESLRMPKYFDP